MTQSIDQFADIIDVRDIIERIEELEEQVSGAGSIDGTEIDGTDEAEELSELRALMSDLKGTGGDEKWRGDWYPDTLIRDSHFRDYAMELADDIGAIPDGVRWPITCIDWDQAARELQMDYSSVEFRGVTFWTR